MNHVIFRVLTIAAAAALSVVAFPKVEPSQDKPPVKKKKKPVKAVAKVKENPEPIEVEKLNEGDKDGVSSDAQDENPDGIDEE